MSVEIGQAAPEFTLPDGDNKPVSLSDFRGSKTVVVFIPFPFSGICTTEMCAMRDDYAALSGQDAKIVVITCDQRHANRVWGEQNNFQFPVLSDYWPHGATAQKYGCFNEASGGTFRWSFVLDADGIVRSIIKSDAVPQAREHAEYAKALAAI